MKIVAIVKRKRFFMYVLKEQYINLKRNRNKIIVNNFKKYHDIKKAKLGLNFIYS